MPLSLARRLADALAGRLRCGSVATCAASLLLLCSAAHAQQQRPLPNLTGIVKDQGWARILGKALFWDTIANARGSDCAGCHFATDANRRIPDQSAPPLQLRRVAATAAGATADMALDPGFSRFVSRGWTLGVVDACSRRVSLGPRELADFGPGRAAPQRHFVATDPSCTEDATARLASILLQQRPLGTRTIDPEDATFGRSGPHGNLVSPTGRGLDRTYQWMIQQAFEDTLWKSPPERPASGAAMAPLAAAPAPTVQGNFALFWGISLMVYESTLDPRWSREHETARTARARLGESPKARAEWE